MLLLHLKKNRITKFLECKVLFMHSFIVWFRFYLRNYVVPKWWERIRDGCRMILPQKLYNRDMFTISESLMKSLNYSRSFIVEKTPF